MKQIYIPTRHQQSITPWLLKLLVEGTVLTIGVIGFVSLALMLIGLAYG